MGWRSIYVRVFWLWAISAHLFGFAQGQSTVNPSPAAADGAQTVESALHQMSDRAAIIFIGTVEGVRRVAGNGPGAGVVEIRFGVDQPLRGCSGATYVLREWGGLWNANDSRYRVGQRILLMLHAPGASGLSSPVGGMDGAIPLRASGAGVRPNDTGAASAAEQVADLRWIGARLTHTVRYSESKPAAKIAGRAISGAPSAEAETAAVAGADASVPDQEISAVNLANMIRQWGVASHETR